MTSRASDGRRSVFRSLKLVQQNLAHVIVLAKQLKVSSYSYGYNRALDKAIDRTACNVHCLQVDHPDMHIDGGFRHWYDTIRWGGSRLIDDLRQYHMSYANECEITAKSLAMERSERYHSFMKSAVSHKNG